MSHKYLDRKMASRSSRLTLSRSTSPTTIPGMAPHRLDNFALSVKKHMVKSYNINPENTQVHSIRYYIENQINNQENKQKEEKKHFLHARRHSVLVSGRKESPYKIEVPSYLQEVPKSVRYEQKIAENIKHYGKGLLRHQHRNSLTDVSKQKDLLELHYRLKKQRESSIIAHEERQGKQRLRELLSRYDSL